MTGKARDVAQVIFRVLVKLPRLLKDVPWWVFAKLHADHGVPLTTIRSWWSHIVIDPGWRPWHTRHCERNRIFTLGEERVIAREIIMNCLRKSIYFCNRDFRTVAFDHAIRKINAMSHEEAEAFISEHNFQCSDGYIEKFKDRHKFSSRRFHCRRRANNVSEREVEAFRLEIERLLQTVGPEKVVNIDETHWKLFPNGMLTWAETGAENVQIETGGLEKAGITVVAAITAAGAKLSLPFLGAGETDRVHATQVGYAPGHWVNHSPSRW
jgi:hypothetical protein